MYHRETDAAKVARNIEALFDLHARAIALHGGLHRHPLRLRQVRLRGHPGVPVRRHGARRQDPLQRHRPAARRVGDAEPVPGPRLGDLARDRAHVVRRPGDDALVQRRVDEGGVRQLHGREDREPLVPRGESRPALPLRALPRRLRRRSHRRHQRDPPAARQPQRGRQPLRRDHLPEGADRHAAPRAGARRRVVPRRPARVPQGARLRQRHLERPHRRARRADAGRPGRMEPRLGREPGAADHRHRARNPRRADRAAGLPPGRQPRPRPGLAAAAAGDRSTSPTDRGRSPSLSMVPEPPRPRWWAGRRRATCCRPAAAGPTATSSSTRCRAATCRAVDRQHRRSGHARRGLGHAVGDDARRRHHRQHVRRRGDGRGGGRTGRTEPGPAARLRLGRMVAALERQRTGRARRRRREDAAQPGSTPRPPPARKRRGSGRCGGWRRRRRR